MKGLSENKQLTINMIAQVITFIVNICINFFITPYIVNKLGEEAYGFIGLANDFVNYATLITIALNSMSGRFMTIAIYKGDKKTANGYFNSIFAANCILSVFMLIPSVLCVLFIDKLVDVPLELITDVKLTFSIVFFNFILGNVQSAFSMGYFVRNKLYINSFITILTNLIKTAVIVLLFLLMKPHITYLVFGAMIATVAMTCANIYFNKKLMPELILNKNDISIKYIKQLISSGIWNCITKLSQIFSSSLDLLITNIFIDASAMGTLAVAKTIPNTIVSLISSIASVFAPNMTIYYAKDDIDGLVRETRKSMKFMALFSNIQPALIIVLGMSFFKLWTPNQEPKVLVTLSILICFNICISGTINPLYHIFTITDTVKKNSIAMIINSVISLVTTLLCLKYTNLGIYAVAGVSTVLSIIISFVFHIPMSAKVLNRKIYTFYPEVIKSIISFLILSVAGVLVIRRGIIIDTWTKLIFAAVVMEIAGIVFNLFFLLNTNERKYLFNIIKKKVLKK